ncbi:MAG TPA: TIR domain-containing protein [Allosphingosinicella sp.]|jgi:tetratricopeptide (TPR) repeat protein
MNEGATAVPHYTAFLSYSHKDADAARRLHRRLEAYRLPKRLVGAAGARGEVPARLTPVFRDREELPAAGDLSEMVRSALAQSRALIVLCSPGSAASPWVAREITAFRELHPGRPVLAAIIAGEPCDCFPAPLLANGSEPIAADLRPERDGQRLGFLKLVAGLAGVPLDALVQRDAQRRLRRVTAVTVGALVAMLAMTVMTAMAVTARTEAERQRAEAEGLIDFMLTDLRDRLRKVGRLDVMQAVNARALLYYRGDSAAPGSTGQPAARQARTYLAIGEDHLERGDLDGALAAFRKAGSLARRELALFPADPQLLLDAAKSDNGIGRVEAARENWSAAERQFRAYAEATEPLAAAALAEAAAASINLGNAAAGRKDEQTAERHYGKAVRLLGTAASLNEGDSHLRSILANAEAWLADTFYRRGLWQQSLEHRRRQHAILQGLRSEERQNAETDFRFAASDRGLACSLWKTGDRHAAAVHFREAYEAAVKLDRRDPDNARWRLLRQKLADDLLRAGIDTPPGSVQPAGEVKGCTG